jgi:hypothetical protein
MNNLKRLIGLVLMAAVVSLGGIGCNDTSEPSAEEQPAEEQLTDEHPTDEHPTDEHPAGEHPE